MTAFIANGDELLDKTEAASYLGLKHPHTLAVWRNTKRHNVPFVRIGRNVRYRRSDLDKYLESRLVK
jgi:excisionase family DNA binding protein